MSDIILRSIGSDEHNVLLNILGESLWQFLDQFGTKNLISSDAFDPDGCFLAREKGGDVGCVAASIFRCSGHEHTRDHSYFVAVRMGGLV